MSKQIDWHLDNLMRQVMDAQGITDPHEQARILAECRKIYPDGKEYSDIDRYVMAQLKEHFGEPEKEASNDYTKGC
jgi:hypothetical protein